MKRIIITGAILLGSLVSFNAMAQMSMEDAQSAVERRQAVFKLLSFSNGPLGMMARGQMDFDLDVAIKGTERVAMLAGLIPELFWAADTSGVDGITTRAADTIWTSRADFESKAANLAAGANMALEILNTQGEAGLRDAVAAIGPNCGACHDAYRLD